MRLYAGRAWALCALLWRFVTGTYLHGAIDITDTTTGLLFWQNQLEGIIIFRTGKGARQGGRVFVGEKCETGENQTRNRRWGEKSQKENGTVEGVVHDDAWKMMRQCPLVDAKKRKKERKVNSFCTFVALRRPAAKSQRDCRPSSLFKCFVSLKAPSACWESLSCLFESVLVQLLKLLKVYTCLSCTLGWIDSPLDPCVWPGRRVAWRRSGCSWIPGSRTYC